MGALGAISMGLLVYYINSDHGVLPAVIAASKQAVYTLFFGALFVKMAENIAVQLEERAVAVLCGGLIPTLLTSILTYILHTIKGTPEPFHSTVPTMVTSVISFSLWAYLRHRAIYSSQDDTA